MPVEDLFKTLVASNKVLGVFISRDDLHRNLLDLVAATGAKWVKV
jgi:hypothetical protein